MEIVRLDPQNLLINPPTYADLEATYQNALFSRKEPNLFRIFLQKQKHKVVRRKLGRFVKNGWTQKGNACFVVTSRTIGFYKV